MIIPIIVNIFLPLFFNIDLKAIVKILKLSSFNHLFMLYTTIQNMNYSISFSATLRSCVTKIIVV